MEAFKPEEAMAWRQQVQQGPSPSGTVENTALWVACKRALVTSRALSLLHDPVTPAMLPPGFPLTSAWAAQAVASDMAAAAGKAAEPDRQAVLTLALRCRFIDDQLSSLLFALRRQLAAAAGRGGSRPAIQVVLLGAGLDTRPWRLHLGAEVSWFELDLPAMAAYKRECLARAGASTAPPSAGAAASKSSQRDDSSRGGGGSGGSSRFPLRCARYAAVTADLAAPGWLDALQGAGWKGSYPTIWVIEGVFYYLSQEAADQLLQEVTAASQAVGTGALVVSLCTPAMVQAINSVKGSALEEASSSQRPPATDRPPAIDSWWFEASFPDYQATLGDDPCAALLQAGWETAHACSIADAAMMYGEQRSTHILPEAARALAEGACGSQPAQYQIAAATLGLS